MSLRKWPRFGFMAGFVGVLAAGAAMAEVADGCKGFGPQTPRDISQKEGENGRIFSFAPDPSKMNLCDIHFHKNAEHKGPGYSEFVGPGEFGGYRCNESAGSAAAAPADGPCEHLQVGDTIEVHWVYTSCDVEPGHGLGSCLGELDICRNPTLRVEAQVFLVVDEPDAPSFANYAYDEGSAEEGGYHQPRDLPAVTGTPVTFLGSTTGPSFNNETCSPFQVTWSVRPQCAEISYESLGAWCGTEPFQETKAHGVRELVTDPKLLSKIE